MDVGSKESYHSNFTYMAYLIIMSNTNQLGTTS